MRGSKTLSARDGKARYAKYKPTGIPWLPQVPEEWEERRARYLFKKEQRPVRPNDEIVTAFRDGQVTLRKNRRTTGFTEATDYSHYQGIRKGDLVIHQMDAFAGCAGVSDSNGMGTPVLSVCTPIRGDVNVHYVAHIVRLMGRNGYIQSLARGIRERSCDFRFETFARQLLPLPPLPTQRAIVAFLDEKCGKVDRLVAAKEKEVALLKELRERVIADAVTKGVGDFNAETQRRRERRGKTKPSGIPWLPEVPEGWEVRRLGAFFTDDVRANKDFVFTRALKFNYGELVPKNEIGEPDEYRDVYVKYSVLQKDDILINGLNLNYDFVSQRVAQARCDGIITSAYLVLRPRTGVFSDYFSYLFKAMDYMKMFHGMGSGIRLTLSFRELKSQLLPLPPLAEQKAIVAYIEARAEKIDAAVAKLEAEVAALKEYKQRLIADVVTGQRKVA